VKTLLST